MTNGFETRELVEAQLEALHREQRGHIWSAAHGESIKKQIKFFAKELKRLEAEGDPVDINKNRRGRSMLVRNASTGEDHTEWVN